jgi:DNA-binding NtrC family response regulator
MDPLDDPPIRTLETVEREHVEETLRAYGDRVPQWRIAVELGISPTTLTRRLKKWANGESTIRDRR